MQVAPLWKASVTLAKESACDAAALMEITPPKPQAVLVDEEVFGARATVEALYGSMPDGALLSKLLGHDVHVALIPDQDWVRLSHEGLPPVRAGRFFVHGTHAKATIPHGSIALHIEAGLAFGTGHHESTALCLSLLCELARRCRFRSALDLGCGTGVLAIAMAHLWKSDVVAADIDPVAVEVAGANARRNSVRPFVRTVVADGLAHPSLARASPFDLIVANILAGPLTRLALPVVRALAPGGMLLLSGLLRWQENLVLSFYRPHGIVLREARREGNWSALLLERVRRAG